MTRLPTQASVWMISRKLEDEDKRSLYFSGYLYNFSTSLKTMGDLSGFFKPI
jgi:hypothetical protein